LRATLERHPLTIGLVGLLSGAVLARLLPATLREQKWVGNTPEKLGRAVVFAHEAVARYAMSRPGVRVSG
jgi:hypothetical protein